ncbi:MAG: CaiB/BaiF CoA transferase family protein [Acidimicrobiales bacterium]
MADAPSGPLNGLVVVDLTRVLAGPYCTMVLADLGARVIKVEHPNGDDARRIGPFIDGVSAYFASVNRGKEALTLDLKTDADRALFEDLVEGADVLIENFRPGVMDRLGYPWADVHRRWPRLVYAAVSGFGRTGPYAERPAYDMVVQGMGGIMSVTGHPGGPPTRVGTSIGDITAGLFTTIGVLAALRERDATGVGQLVDVAMLDCQVAILENAVARYAATGEVPGPIGSRHPSIAPFGAFEASDGWIIIAAGNDDLFSRLCGVIGRPELTRDDRFATNASRTAHADDLGVEIERALATANVAQWLDRLADAGLPCGPINDVAAVLADPQVAARNMAVRIVDPNQPELDGLVVAGNPIKLSGHDDPTTRGPVPGPSRS